MPCECGCGQETTKRFAHGHNRRGTTRSAEAIAKLKATWQTRRESWKAAQKVGASTPEARANYSRAKKGRALSEEHKQKIGDANRGVPKSRMHRKHLAEALRVDDVVFNSEGRAISYAPSHPAADRRGRVRRARLVIEQQIGRLLTRNELAHHINFDVADDRPDNLMVMTRWSHTVLHHRLRQLAIEDHFRLWLSRAECEGALT